ncbi:hypothetical protein E3N88_23996 [Mikania micrantha]|uniref:DC1 domain-containing protein n=1 Tax=Mikania micrantha TaxID=192012 RepID=A0A5N6NHD3_9ASTR|nr:hypothetical protein E3N88_23996 [Mikania micrantha]
MCSEEIYWFHLCYYSCKDCNYSLHKFCAQLPKTKQDDPLHPGHDLTLSKEYQFSDPDLKLKVGVDTEWLCDICFIKRSNFYNYHCDICNFDIDIICATLSEQKMDHPSHPHQLQRYLNRMITSCYACGDEHSGTFFHCTTCFLFMIHLNCCLLPVKLLIQQFTNGSFSHSHMLTLSFSFPFIERKAKFFPVCRVCNKGFVSNIWLYRCDRCRYYAHVSCAASRKEAFMSYLTYAGPGKTYKNFKDDDHPSLIPCPFPDESFNLLMHHFINKGKLPIKGKIDDNMFSHEHPLVLFDTQESLLNKSVSLHDPVNRVQLLCDGCVRPITDIPFYKCSQHSCDFVLHEWCTRLPSEIHDHHDHPEHTLVLLQKAPTNFFGVFWCEICRLPSNGFAYGCKQCEYLVDVNCGFLPDAITHEAHPNHLLQRFKTSADDLRTGTCASSMHTACAPLKLQCEQSTSSFTNRPIFEYYHVKFGRRYKIRDHQHNVTLVQGINADGHCVECQQQLQYYMIFKCFGCKYAIHTECFFERQLDSST